jgi:hypothetical protein
VSWNLPTTATEFVTAFTIRLLATRPNASCRPQGAFRTFHGAPDCLVEESLRIQIQIPPSGEEQAPPTAFVRGGGAGNSAKSFPELDFLPFSIQVDFHWKDDAAQVTFSPQPETVGKSPQHVDVSLPADTLQSIHFVEFSPIIPWNEQIQTLETPLVTISDLKIEGKLFKQPPPIEFSGVSRPLPVLNSCSVVMIFIVVVIGILLF